LKTQKWKIVLARQNSLLLHGHSTHKGADSLSLLIFLTQLALPLDLDWARSKVHNLLDWLKCYANLGEQFSLAKGLSKNPEEPGTTDKAGN
jgi:hypothetical protein